MRLDTKTLLRPTIILGLIGLLSAYALSHIKKITYPNILRQEREKQETALSMVLPGYVIQEQRRAAIDGSDFVYWVATKTEKNAPARAYAFIAERPGYSGPVRSIVGVDEKGVLLGISILQQSETPGLGARSVEIASRETFWGRFFGSRGQDEAPARPWFQEQFRGLDSNRKIAIVKKGDWNDAMRQELIEKNAVSAITGATITTKAVRDGLASGAEKLKRAVAIQPGAAEAVK